MSRDVATRRVYRPFIVKGPAAWTESWHAPRYAGGFHLHEGQDVLCRDGAPVLAATAGRVEFDVDTLGGRIARLFLPDGDYWYYAHLSDWNSTRRQRLPGRTRRCDRVLRELGRRGRRADARPLRTLSPVGAGRGHDVRPHRLARGGRTPCRRLRATRRGGQVDDHGRSDLPARARCRINVHRVEPGRDGRAFHGPSIRRSVGHRRVGARDGPRRPPAADPGPSSSSPARVAGGSRNRMTRLASEVVTPLRQLG